MGESRLVTESWKERRFELDLSDLFFRANRTVAMARVNPVYPMLRRAYAEVESFVTASPFSIHYVKELEEKVLPTLRDIDIILSGNPKDPNVMIMSYNYGCSVTLVRGRYASITNAQKIIEDLKNILFLVKQWGMEQGIFFTKPSDRKYGPEAMSSVFEM